MKQKISHVFKSGQYNYRLAVTQKNSILNPTNIYTALVIERDFKNDGEFKEVMHWHLEDVKHSLYLPIRFDWVVTVPTSAWDSLNL